MSTQISSIACIASLMHHPEGLDDFRSLDPEATETQRKDHLGYKQYKLQDYQSYDGTWRYGITPVEPAAPGMAQHRSPPNFRLPKKKQLLILYTCVDIVFGITMIVAIGIIVAYLDTSSDSPFKKILNSKTFGPRFIMVHNIASHSEFSMC